MRALGAGAGEAAGCTVHCRCGRQAGERRGARGSSPARGRAGMATSTTQQAWLPGGRCEARRGCSPSLLGIWSLISAAWAAVGGKGRTGLPGRVELFCFCVGKAGWVEENLCLRENGCSEQCCGQCQGGGAELH